MDKLTVACFNVLNDERAPLYGVQEDRVDDLSKCINKSIPSSGRYLLYLCEVSNEQNLKSIATNSGLEIIKSAQYTDNEYTEWMAFLGDKTTARESECNYIIYPEDHDRSGTLVLKNGNTTVVGGHMPHRMNVRDSIERGYIAENMMRRAENENSIIIGDFNALPFFPSQLKFGFNGYKDAFKGNRPIFPSGIGPTKHLPLYVKFFKNLSIDAIKYKGDLERISSQSFESKASDHPLIVVEFRL